MHIRTTNPIESTFSTVRLRTKRSRNRGSRETTLALVYKLLQSAQKRRKPRNENRSPRRRRHDPGP